VNRSLIDRPAASSPAVLIRWPLDKRWKLLASLPVEKSKFRWALSEETFVLMMRPMCVLHDVAGHRARIALSRPGDFRGDTPCVAPSVRPSVGGL